MRFPETLPSDCYRDHALAYERAEATTCKGCVRIVKFLFAGKSTEICCKGRKIGKRCKHYAEKPVNAD